MYPGDISCRRTAGGAALFQWSDQSAAATDFGREAKQPIRRSGRSGTIRLLACRRRTEAHRLEFLRSAERTTRGGLKPGFRPGLHRVEFGFRAFVENKGSNWVRFVIWFLGSWRGPCGARPDRYSDFKLGMAGGPPTGIPLRDVAADVFRAMLYPVQA